MSQVFAATVYDGVIGSAGHSSSFGSMLLKAAKHPDRDNRFLRYLLGEMLKCVFFPDQLDPVLYATLLDQLPDKKPIYPDKIEINALYSNGLHSPSLSAHAIFYLPIQTEISCAEWTTQHKEHSSIASAVRLYWTFPWDSNTGTPDNHQAGRVLDETGLNRLDVDRIAFMPINC